MLTIIWAIIDFYCTTLLALRGLRYFKTILFPVCSIVRILLEAYFFTSFFYGIVDFVDFSMLNTAINMLPIAVLGNYVVLFTTLFLSLTWINDGSTFPSLARTFKEASSQLRLTIRQSVWLLFILTMPPTYVTCGRGVVWLRESSFLQVNGVWPIIMNLARTGLLIMKAAFLGIPAALCKITEYIVVAYNRELVETLNRTHVSKSQKTTKNMIIMNDVDRSSLTSLSEKYEKIYDLLDKLTEFLSSYLLITQSVTLVTIVTWLYLIIQMWFTMIPSIKLQMALFAGEAFIIAWANIWVPAELDEQAKETQGIQVGGFWTANKAFVLTVVSAVVTYLVLLIGFTPASPEDRFFNLTERAIRVGDIYPNGTAIDD